MKRLLRLYLVSSGILLHVAVAYVVFTNPQYILSAWYRVDNWLTARLPSVFASDTERAAKITVDLDQVTPRWQPFRARHGVPPGHARIGNRLFEDPVQATHSLRDGETLLIGAGQYRKSLVISASQVTIEGDGNVHFSHAQALGKGNFVVKGNDVLIRNIQCSQIRVADRNGSCIRHEGENLTVDHVYLHDSQQGILTGNNPGLVIIRDSRFERLGNNGQAHGIYIGGGRLLVEDSIFLASKSEGHEIKSRATATLIMNSVIASLDGRDSRLIDLPNGGDFSLFNNVLEQGPHSRNGDVIGYALETGATHGRVAIKNNIFILERAGYNRLFHTNESVKDLTFSGNIIVASDLQHSFDIPLAGNYFTDRKSAGFPPYPSLPPIEK